MITMVSPAFLKAVCCPFLGQKMDQHVKCLFLGSDKELGLGRVSCSLSQVDEIYKMSIF